MPVVQIMLSAVATQIEGFPAKGKGDKPFQRSAKGALHIRPGSTRVLTVDELGFIRKHHPAVARSMHVLAEDSALKGVSKQNQPTESGKGKPQGLGSGKGETSESAKETAKGKGGKGKGGKSGG
jgi:hypothetical protein